MFIQNPCALKVGQTFLSNGHRQRVYHQHQVNEVDDGNGALCSEISRQGEIKCFQVIQESNDVGGNSFSKNGVDPSAELSI